MISLGPIHVCPGGKRIIQWNCLCSCGSRRLVNAPSLKSGNTRSCGCLQREIAARVNTTHGYCIGQKTRTYRCWRNMINRCENPNVPGFRDYGGRGIKVCRRWHVFENFIADMGECPPALELERRDNDLGYERGNVRWATKADNCRNRRSNVNLTIDGETLCATEWSYRSGIRIGTIYSRLRKGWSDQDAVFCLPLQ